MSILYVCMGYDEDSYMDAVMGNCSFDSEEFKKILEFASHFPENPQENGESYSTAELLANSRLLLSQAYVKDISEIKKYYADFNGDLTFIGFPGWEGQGKSAFSGGISSQSENKEGAWRFIQSLFTKEIQTNRYAWGIPVLQSVYDEKMEAATSAYYELDENGNEIEVANSPYAVFFDGTYAVTEAEAEQFEELMRNTHEVAISSTGSQVYKIIEEESAPYFAGQKSLEEVTGIIQNRVQLYISENL